MCIHAMAKRIALLLSLVMLIALMTCIESLGDCTPKSNEGQRCLHNCYCRTGYECWDNVCRLKGSGGFGDAGNSLNEVKDDSQMDDLLKEIVRKVADGW